MWLVLCLWKFTILCPYFTQIIIQHDVWVCDIKYSGPEQDPWLLWACIIVHAGSLSTSLYIKSFPFSHLHSVESTAMSQFKRQFTLSYLSAHPCRSDAQWHQRLEEADKFIWLLQYVEAEQSRGSSENLDLVLKKSHIHCIMHQVFGVKIREGRVVTDWSIYVLTPITVM